VACRSFLTISRSKVSNLAEGRDVRMKDKFRTNAQEAPVKYMLLLRHAPDAGPAEGTPEFGAEMAKWGEVMGDIGQSGSMVAAHGLDTEATATTVRIRNGEALVSDGPFAETKEAFFSYIIIDVPDLDAALRWAKKMPNATYGSGEVRPLSSHEQDA
jgi:hypothetical protein